jgi:hemerythrin-like domain-containing protein
MAGTKASGAMTREMIMVHTGLRREFGLMPEVVRGVSDGDWERAQIVADYIELIGTTLEHHHIGEDQHIWPRLLQRCPAEILPLVHGMEKQHARIATLDGALTKGIAAWRADAKAANREAVLGTLGVLLPVLREHLGAEEEYVLPLVERHITGDEWDAMVAESASAFPPDMRPLLFGIMMYEGDPTAVGEALDKMPDDVRRLITEAAPRLYGDYAERVYGTRTPELLPERPEPGWAGGQQPQPPADPRSERQ